MGASSRESLSEMQGVYYGNRPMRNLIDILKKKDQEAVVVVLDLAYPAISVMKLIHTPSVPRNSSKL